MTVPTVDSSKSSDSSGGRHKCRVLTVTTVDSRNTSDSSSGQHNCQLMTVARLVTVAAGDIGVGF